MPLAPRRMLSPHSLERHWGEASALSIAAILLTARHNAWSLRQVKFHSNYMPTKEFGFQPLQHSRRDRGNSDEARSETSRAVSGPGRGLRLRRRFHVLAECEGCGDAP